MNIIYKTSESWTLDYEEFIAKYCYEKNIPILGICAGYNNTIMGLGGKAEKITNVDIHDRPDLQYAHKCNFSNLKS